LQNLIAANSQTLKKYWQLDSTPAADRPQKAPRLRAELAQLAGVIPIDKVPMNARTALAAGECGRSMFPHQMLGSRFASRKGGKQKPCCSSERARRRLPSESRMDPRWGRFLTCTLPRLYT